MPQTLASIAPNFGSAIAAYGNLLDKSMEAFCGTPAHEPIPTDPRAAMAPPQFRPDVLMPSARPSQFTFNLQEPVPADRNAHPTAAWTKPAIPDPGPGMIATEWAESDSDNESDDGSLRERGESRV